MSSAAVPIDGESRGGPRTRKGERTRARLLAAAKEVFEEKGFHDTRVSDMGSGFGQVRAEGLSSGGPSIDHAVWFHADLRVEDWMLLELSPSKATGARGIYTGGLRDSAGTLGLFCAQELLLRPHSPERLGAMRDIVEGRRSLS